MKLFHISDILSITTEMLVSSRHMEGIYEILNFMTKDNLFTHQLSRAANECTPWLKVQYPQLFSDNLEMKELLDTLQLHLKNSKNKSFEKDIKPFIEAVMKRFKLPEMLPVYELGEDMHTYIDPMEEAQAMMGDDKVIKLDL